MGWLHKTRVWYLLATAYVIAAFRISASAPLPLCGSALALRVVSALVSSANVRISDSYHNADLKPPETNTKDNELKWMRFDYVGISAILTYNQFIWGGNCAWAGMTRLAAAYSGACLAIVAVCAPKLDGNRDGFTKIVKYITGTQFVLPMTCIRRASNPLH